MSDPVVPPAEELAKGSKLFSFLDEAGRRRLLAKAQTRRVVAGETVVRENDPGDSFFVILKGSVQVSVDDLGTEKEIAKLGEGAFFGEIAVVTSQPRSATVVALENLQLLEFPKAEVEEVLKDYPKVREVLGKVGVMRSEDTLEKVLKG